MAALLEGDGEVSTSGRPSEPTAAEVEFRVAVVYEDREVRVRPVGEVDLGTIGRLRERMREAMAADVDRLVLDLRATTFLDSNGLHLAMDVEGWATRGGIEFVIVPGPPVVQKAFEVSGLSAQLPFVDGA